MSPRLPVSPHQHHWLRTLAIPKAETGDPASAAARAGTIERRCGCAIIKVMRGESINRAANPSVRLPTLTPPGSIPHHEGDRAPPERGDAGAAAAARRPLLDRARARQRRDGDRVPGAGRRAGPAGGAQAARPPPPPTPPR